MPAVKPPLNKSAYYKSDAFVVVNVTENRIVESHWCSSRAMHAVDVLHNHARENRLSDKFAMFPRSEITVEE